MLLRSPAKLVLFAVVMVLAPGTNFGQEKPGADQAIARAADNLVSATTALGLLQRAHEKDGAAFVVQEELDDLIQEGGGGACASAAAVNLLQTIRVMAGKEKLPNPHKAVLAAFRNDKALLKGRVTNEQLTSLFDFYQSYADGVKLSVKVDSAPNSGYRAHNKTWDEQAGPDLDVAPRQIKLVSYTVTSPTEGTIGRHFVLLKARSADQIEVVDPAGPTKDRRYVLEFRTGDKGSKARLFLNNPPEFPRRGAFAYEVNTVFTASIGGVSPRPDRVTQSPISVEYVCRRIDETASELHGTKNYLNPREWRRRTASFGLPGLDLPIEHGGSAWPAASMVEVFKRAGYHNLNFRDVVGGAHVRPLLGSTDNDVAQVVRDVANGAGYIAIAITEPSAGSDVPSIKSTAVKVEGGYRLTGTKRFNARLDQASHVVLFTQGTTGKPGRLSVFVVPINTPGLTIEKLEAHGLTGNSYGGVSFKDLFVPETRMIGKDGEGLRIFHHHFLYWRLMQAAAAIGTGEGALDQMAKRIKTREAFGGPIGRFTHLQQPLGQHSTELRMAHLLAKEAAVLIDRGDYDGAEALINGLKAEGVEIALRAIDAATRAYGGEGYSTMVDLGDRLKDLNGLRIADGTTDVMRMLVVRRVFGEEYWQMAVQDRSKENPQRE